MQNRLNGITRRDILTWSSIGVAQLFFSPSLFPRLCYAAASPMVVDLQKWARLEELAPGVWAVVSTPMEHDDWTTGCNGGLIAGTDRVLAIESFVRPEGARWLGEQARKLTGKRPTDVIITHFHGDHANGLQGYAAGDDRPIARMTSTTKKLIAAADSERDTADAVRAEMLNGAKILAADGPTSLDLGDRTVEIHPRRGHTPSDVTIEIDDPSIVFCGDLIWNGLFPNYRDTIPTAFAESIRSLRRQQQTAYVSGHGALANAQAIEQLLNIIDGIGEIAQRGHEAGRSAEETAAQFELPPESADWVLFNPKYFEVAVSAWYRELGEKTSDQGSDPRIDPSFYQA